jgi:hypothetical protein
MNTENIKIGITISLKDAEESFWTNGMKINILTLIRLLSRSKQNYDIYLLNTSNIDLSKRNPILNGIQLFSIEEKYREMDLLISMGSQISREILTDFKSLKSTNKVITYKCGNNYVLAIEEILFKESKGILKHNF